MKTLFSLKSRIGAILTAAALMATAMPMTGFAAASQTAPDLLVNGNFSVAATEGQTFGETKQVTLTADQIPAGWEVRYDESDYEERTDGYKSGMGANMAAARRLYFYGDAFSIAQKVKGIEPLTTYAISCLQSSTQNAVVMVNFLNYDEETDTYKTLSQYVADYNAADEDATNDISIPKLVAGGTTTSADYVSRRYSVRGGDRNMTDSYYFSFTTPKYTNAVEVVLGSDGDNCHPNQATYFDDVTLKRATDVVYNGGFQYKKNNNDAAGFSGSMSTQSVDGNNYFVINGPGAAQFPQNIVIKTGQKYRVRFKYKHTLGDTIADKSPNVQLVGCGNSGDDRSIPLGYTATPVGTDGDWTIYEGSVYASQSLSNPGSGLYNMNLLFRSRGLQTGETWTLGDGQTMCYDDLSITEVTTLGTNFAGGISVDYSPAYAGETAEIIVAKYDPATGDFVGIEHETIGSGAKAGYFTTYVSSLASAYDVKVFLWDGLGTMKPITSTINRASTIAELPYFNDFENAAEVVGFEYDAHSYTSDSTCKRCGTLHSDITKGQNGNLVVKDGALSFENSDWDGTVCFWYNNYRAEPFHNVELQFKPQTSDIIVFEFDYNLANNGDAVRLGNGFFTVFDSAGNKAAGWYGYNGDGGVYDGGVKVDGKIQGYSWAHAHKDHHFKVEVDLNNKQWTVSGTNVAKPETVYSTGDIADISKLSIGLTNSTDKIDNLRIYKKITAQQADTAFTLNVGEVATAAVTYTPATETMPDLTFASSNTAIARVTPNGLITAVRAGTATITATSEMYGANLSWTVTVPDTKTVTPVELPYDSADTFATAGQEIKDLEGWTVYNRQANAVLTTADGMLVASDVVSEAKSGKTGAVQAKLAFKPVKSGKLVIEVGYKNVNREVKTVAASEGLLNIYSENGTKIAAIGANGRGDGKALNAGAWSTILNHANWQWGGAIKFVIDIDSYSYQVYQNDNLLSEKATSNSTFYLMGFDVASLDFTFSNEGDCLEYVKVYVPEEVSGDETVAE